MQILKTTNFNFKKMMLPAYITTIYSIFPNISLSEVTKVNFHFRRGELYQHLVGSRYYHYNPFNRIRSKQILYFTQTDRLTDR